MSSGIVLDADFDCASAGEIRVIKPSYFEIDYQVEKVVDWFQKQQDQGRGGPKEYTACVRARNTDTKPGRVCCKFLSSPGKGRNYLGPPWWIRGTWGWEMIDVASTTSDADHNYVEITVDIEADSSVLIASAPFVDPDAVCRWARSIADRYAVWSFGDIGTSASGRLIPLVETPERPLKVVVCATPQSAEPVSWGILHIAEWLTIPTASTKRLLDNVQFCLLPMTNPDGVAEGRSISNSLGEVPKFSWHLDEDGGKIPVETEAILTYLDRLRPDLALEIHAHHRWDSFWRTVAVDVPDAVPKPLRHKAEILDKAIRREYSEPDPETSIVMMDVREPERRLFGNQRLHQIGVLREFLQSVPAGLDAHRADVRRFVETTAEAIIETG